MNAKEAIALGQQNSAVMVDLKFIDLVESGSIQVFHSIDWTKIHLKTGLALTVRLFGVFSRLIRATCS